MKYSRRLVASIAIIMLPLALGVLAGCNKSDAETQSAAGKATTGQSEKSSTAANDQFALPKGGSPEELLAFINRIGNPPSLADSEKPAYFEKAASAISLAADRILAADPTDEQAYDAANAKLEALRIKGELGDKKTSDEAAGRFLDQMVKYKRAALRGPFARMRLSHRLESWETQSDAEKLAVFKQYVDDIKANGLTRGDAGTLEQLSILLSSLLFPTSDAAAKPFSELLPLFRASENPDIARTAPYFEAVVRRLDLPGKKLELEGNLIDGKPFDWNSYRGKVVLIDFWATDCSECIMEVPNTVKYYHMYRDKGFEVVGVNLDADRAQASRLVEEAGIEWPSLFSGEPDPDGDRWFHPLAAKYGIKAIPRCILVDKDGTVVHMNARGPILGEMLKKLLGEPAKAEENLFAVPDGTPAEIIKFVQMRITTLGRPRSMEEQKTLQSNLRNLLIGASEKILSGKPTIDEASEAIQMKIQLLKLTDLGDSTPDKELEKLLGQLESIEQPAVAGAMAQINAMKVMAGWADLPAAERTAAIDKYIGQVKKSGPAKAHVMALMRLGERASSTGDNELALRAVTDVLPLYKESTEPAMKKHVVQLEGLERRLKLPGGQIEVEGTLLDGKPFDWKSYRGKVVLVNYWASWNQQSRQEISTILDVYKKYHDKGFEVVGISLDDRKAELEGYVRDAQIPWPSIYSDQPDASGGESPMAVRYAVFEIPLAILVDRDGKVVSMFARGPALEKQVEQLFSGQGLPPAQKADKSPGDDKQ